MIDFKSALDLLVTHCITPETETLSTENALGRRLAQPVIARLNQPPFDSSAMDGYAVRLSDVTEGKARLKLIGEAPAGQPFLGQVKNGEAVRIFTGSVVPEGAETVIIQENVEREGDTIFIKETFPQARHIRKTGQDFRAGQTLISQDAVLSASHIALALAGNVDTVEVYRKPRIAIISNGDELRPVGSDIRPGQIINSNGPSLSALLESWGCEVVLSGILPDRQLDIEAAIEKFSDADIIVPVGGASVGDHDYMKAAFQALGFETMFTKVAVRPGKPSWLAKRGKQAVFGLPGNPASAFVCARLFLPTLLGLEDGPSVIMSRLTESLPENGSRTHFLRGRLYAEQSELKVSPFPSQDSALIRPLAEGNGLIWQEVNAPAATQGDLVRVVPFRLGPLL